MTPPPPPARPKPKLAYWLFDREITDRAAAEALGCSYETVRRICLPFDDDDRRVPGAALMESIFRWTEGEVVPADFYPYGSPIAAVSPAALDTERLQ